MNNGDQDRHIYIDSNCLFFFFSLNQVCVVVGALALSESQGCYTCNSLSYHIESFRLMQDYMYTGRSNGLHARALPGNAIVSPPSVCITLPSVVNAGL